VQAIEQGRYRYTATSGAPELRAAGARWFEAAFGLRYAPDEVMVTAGAKPALLMALDAIVEPGDRGLILAPYWVAYPALVRRAGGEPVIVDPVPDQGFVHDAAAIEAAVRRSGARGLIVNYPNNPSGAVPSRAQIEALVRVAVQHDLWIVSDEIYAQLRYDGAEHASPAAVPGGRERSLVVSGFTKSHTLTGWRIGFLAGSKAVIEGGARGGGARAGPAGAQPVPAQPGGGAGGVRGPAARGGRPPRRRVRRAPPLPARRDQQAAGAAAVAAARRVLRAGRRARTLRAA